MWLGQNWLNIYFNRSSTMASHIVWHHIRRFHFFPVRTFKLYYLATFFRFSHNVNFYVENIHSFTEKSGLLIIGVNYFSKKKSKEAFPYVNHPVQMCACQSIAREKPVRRVWFQCKSMAVGGTTLRVTFPILSTSLSCAQPPLHRV